MRALLALALCSCVSLNVASHRRPPTAAYLVDVALFSAGACIGLDSQFRTRSPEQALVGYGTALAVWLPLWLIPSERLR